jgi:error-prone DNA polymerase
LEHLAEADALRSLTLSSRPALWRIAGVETAPAPPLLAGLSRPHPGAELPLMSLGEQVIADYRSTGLSLRTHPCALLRDRLSAAGTRSCAEATRSRSGARLRTAGIVTVRQRPGTAKGTVFITIEDETGIANIVVWPALVATFRQTIINASLLIVEGRLQRSDEGVTHITAERLADRSRWLSELDAPGEAAPPVRHAPGHPRDERIVARSRDFR